jgi:FixJ family two-component response regulator
MNDSTIISILSVSPFQEDHRALEAIFHQDSGKWKLYTSPTLLRASTLLRTEPLSIIICEGDLRPGSWKEMLEETATLPHSRFLIVTSRLADERLWTEVLSLGGWDVLVKPFDRTEVIRVVESAWQHWESHHHSPARAQGAWMGPVPNCEIPSPPTPTGTLAKMGMY